MLLNSGMYGKKDVQGEVILVRKIIDGYWAVVGPIRPVMRLGSRDEATKMAKSLWKNFILKTEFDGREYIDDLRTPGGITE